MEVVRSRSELRDALASLPRPLGLVPTMGWLHAGHRSLIAQARAECRSVAVSIFVNPRQFDDPADLVRYPRGEVRDLTLCAEAGADLVWVPSTLDVYPPGFDTSVTVDRLARPLEGAARPSHFAGVTTVVAVLFGIVRPDRAYFGEKDGQQLRVIDRMVRDLGITEIVRCPTVREPDGLALSSRNVHLSAEDRAAASVIHRALVAGRSAWEAGERDADTIRARVRESAGDRAAGRGRVRVVRRRRHPDRAGTHRGAGHALGRGALRRHPPHRQRPPRLTARNRVAPRRVPGAGDAPCAAIGDQRGDEMAQRDVQVRSGTRAQLAFAVLVVVAAVVAAACGSSASSQLSAGGAPDAAPSAAAAAAGAPAAREGALGFSANGTTAPVPTTDGSGGVTGSGPLIVRTGQLDLQVADLEAAIRDAESAVTAVGGYVAGSQRSGETDKASASVVFRIPAARWTDALDSLRKLGTKVLGEQTSSQEVTAQVVDLGARLANLGATEAALQGIMEKATKIPDVLAVQEQLTGVRQQIEELTAQKQTMENQAALGTLTVNLTPPPAVAVTQVREGWDPAREVDQAAAALVGLGQGLAGAGIWLLIVGLPILVVFGILALVALVILRRVRRTVATPASLPPAAEA